MPWVSPQFFQADETLFRRCSGIAGPFILMEGALSPYKNQLGLVRALADTDLPIVLIGHVQRQHQGYLEQIQRAPRVRWLGPLEHDDPMLASAYAAAAVLALPSKGEVFPLSVLEALASGTPVVMTDNSALILAHSAFAVKTLHWDDQAGLRKAILELVRKPPARPAVRALVAEHTWQGAAARIVQCYELALRAGESRYSAV